MFKKLFSSKLLKLTLSIILIYFAFSRVNVSTILSELYKVPFWFIFANVLFFGLIYLLGSYRWSLLLFKKPTLTQVFDFTKASYLGSFYSLVFPTGVAGDLVKWIPLQKKYPELTKAKLFSSVFIDRFIGLSALISTAFISTIIGYSLKINIPKYIFYIFGTAIVGLIVGLTILFSTNLEKLLAKIPIVNKLNHLVLLLKKSDKKRLLYCYLLSIFAEFAWITPIWFTSQIFNAGFSLISVYIFIPIISMILVLPISIAGFGAREQLYLFFFTQLSLTPEKILLVSTFSGIINIINSLFGGLFLLF